MFQVRHNNLLNFVDDILSGNLAPLNVLSSFPVDVTEKEKSFTVQADLPGVAKEDIKVSFKDGVLNIEVESKKETPAPESEKSKVWISERSFQKKSRSFTFGKHVDEQNIAASYESGVLTLELPKKEPLAPQTIEVK